MKPSSTLESIMAVNLSIKSVPHDVAERLRARAERNHRSLQGELLATVERAANEDASAASGDINATMPPACGWPPS